MVAELPRCSIHADLSFQVRSQRESAKRQGARIRKTVTSYLQSRCQLRRSQGSAQSNSLDLLRALGLPLVRRGVKPREPFNTRISTRACSHLIRSDTSMSLCPISKRRHAFIKRSSMRASSKPFRTSRMWGSRGRPVFWETRNPSM